MLQSYVINESFVLHADFLETLPEEVTSEWAMYIINYGFCGIEPKFTDWRDKELWLKLKNRIDADKSAYENKKQKQKEYKEKWKQNHAKNTSEYSEYSENSENNGSIPPYTHSVSDIVSESLSVSESVNESVSESLSVSEYEHVSVSDASENVLSLPQQNYASQIYALFHDANLPCNKTETNFIQQDFKNALPKLKGYHSDEVIKAVKNYIRVLKDPECYVNSKMGFLSLVESKIWEKVQPNIFDISDFKNFTPAEKNNDDDWDAPRPENMLNGPTLEEALVMAGLKREA